MKTDKHYVAGIPRKALPEGRVLVHNNVVPQRRLGMNGFQAWTQTVEDTLVLCSCNWAGVNLGGLPHYRERLSRALSSAKPWKITTLIPYVGLKRARCLIAI